MAEKRGTSSTDENGERGDKKERLVTVVLPDDDTLEAMFQEFRSKLRAVCTLSDKAPSWFFLSWEKFDQNKSQLGGDPA